MKPINRVIYQAVLWFIVWASQWAIQEFSSKFVGNNISLLILQVLLILIIAYLLSPKFLVEKKYLIFGILSFLIISGFTYLSLIIAEDPPAILHHPRGGRMHPPRHGPGKPLNGLQRIFFPPSKLFVNFLLLTIANVIATLFEGYNFIKRKEEEAIINKSENLETELKLLKSQINPHFLFNALNNIYALTNIDITKTQKSIINLSDMLRYVLYECDQELVSLGKEISYIQNYIKLFSLKSSKELSIHLDFEKINSNLRIAPMLLIPFVENAFKHSNVENEKGAFISINISGMDSKKIIFTIKNSKPKKQLYKDDVGGIGLVNVKKRLDILYPNKSELMIDDSQNEYHVKLTIELV